MAEITDFIRTILIVATGLYFLQTSILTMKPNPHDSIGKTLLWSLGLFAGLSMLLVPIAGLLLDGLMK